MTNVGVEVASEFPQRIFAIQPENACEAFHGKAILLTDSMIAQLLEALAKCHCPDSVKDFDVLYAKLIALWSAHAPYSSEDPNSSEDHTPSS